MADPDAHQNATLPVAFNRFIEVMNMEQAKDLVRSINSCVHRHGLTMGYCYGLELSMRSTPAGL